MIQYVNQPIEKSSGRMYPREVMDEAIRRYEEENSIDEIVDFIVAARKINRTGEPELFRKQIAP